jgi:hypothetical protein
MKKPTSTTLPSIIEATTEPRILDDSLSVAQEAFLRLVYGLSLTPEQAEIAHEATGLKEFEPRAYRTAFLCCGRRSGKSTRIAGNLVVFEACVNKHPIPAGERGTVLLIGPTERQARHTFRIIEQKIKRSPTLSRLIQSVRNSPNESVIELSNNIDIAVIPANAKHVRGWNLIAVVLEEACFFRDSETGAYNLEEIINAVRPGMLTMPDSKLCIISSPWAQVGYAWSLYRDREKTPDILIWRAPSWVMNPALDKAEIERERQRNENYWRREYAAEWVTAANVLLPSDLVERCVARGVVEFPPKPDVVHCVSLDPSSKGDDFSMCVSHAEGELIVVDYVKAWRAPGRGRYIDYNTVLPHILDTMRRYNAPKAWSDQVSAAAISAALTKACFQFEQTPTYGTKAAPKFQMLRQKIVSGELVLPDDRELVEQLKALEEILAEGGRSTVESRTGKDDKAVCTALAVYAASTQCAVKPWVDFILTDTREERGWHRV